MPWKEKKSFSIHIRYAVYSTSIRDNSLDRSIPCIPGYVIESELPRRIVAQCIRRDGRFTWHVLTIFISRAITWNTRAGLLGTLITAKTYVDPFPETADVG